MGPKLCMCVHSGMGEPHWSWTMYNVPPLSEKHYNVKWISNPQTTNLMLCSE